MLKEYKEIYGKKENLEILFLQPLNMAAFLPAHAAKAAPTLNSLRPLGFRVLFSFFLFRKAAWGARKMNRGTY